MNYSDLYDVIIIGGGPAGLMAAGRAAANGETVVVLEKNNKLGVKLSITGGGRCNITNEQFDVHKMLKNYGDASKFLYSPFSQFDVKKTFSFFEKLGLPLVTEARSRVFPKTQHATDVLDVLVKNAKKHGVEFITDVDVKRFVVDKNKVIAIETSIGKMHGKRFILATGGMSAQSTGSTGDGFRMLAGIGHTIHKSNPNLVPLKTNSKLIHRLAGVTLSFMTMRFKQGGEIKVKKTGKILFTHFGISGPLVINSSHEVAQLLKNGPLICSVDCFPDTNLGDLDKRLVKLFAKNSNKQVKNVLGELVPQKLADAILHIIAPNFGNTPTHSVFKEERRKIAHILKDFAFPIAGTMGLDRAIVADGGLELTEVNFKNMSSTLYPNLHVVGDILNITRPSGGFSLQLCWTTGFVAGENS